MPGTLVLEGQEKFNGWRLEDRETQEGRWWAVLGKEQSTDHGSQKCVKVNMKARNHVERWDSARSYHKLRNLGCSPSAIEIFGP